MFLIALNIFVGNLRYCQRFQNSYIVGVVCFAYLAFYGWKVVSILKSQGIDFDKKISGGH